MRWAYLLIVAAVLFWCAVSCTSAISMEINATPLQAHIGDKVTLNGTISGLKTIAVYLFVTGPDLDNRGVTLENLNIPAGRRLFTTAPVNLNDGTWEYVWDTSVILGTLNPGSYRVYAVSTPGDRLRFTRGEYATVEIEFLASETPANQVSIDPLVPFTALIAGGCITLVLLRRSESH